MTPAREQLLSIDTEIKNLSDKQAELSKEEYDMYELRTSVIREILDEEKPFEGTEWELNVTSQGNVYLAHLGGNDDQLKEVRDMCFRSWHDSFEMKDGIRLDFDDGRFSLHFDDPRQLSLFAQKQSFKIVATDIQDKIRKLSKDLSVLQTIAHQFNLKA